MLTDQADRQGSWRCLCFNSASALLPNLCILQKHRVVIPEADIVKRQVRQSIAYFVHPDDNYLISSLDDGDKYKPITGRDYIKMRFSDTYDYW